MFLCFCVYVYVPSYAVIREMEKYRKNESDRLPEEVSVLYMWLDQSFQSSLQLYHINYYLANWVPDFLNFISTILMTALFVSHKATSPHFLLLLLSWIILDCFSLVHKLSNNPVFAWYAANRLQTPLCEFKLSNANKILTLCVKQSVEETCFTSTLLVCMMNGICKCST